MRIAYITQSYPPMISGAAILVERLAKSMAARGHQVLCIVASDKISPYRSEQGNLTVVRLRSIHNPLRVRQRFLFYPRREVLRALNDFSPDIIHTHEPLLLSRLGQEYARYSCIPTLLTIHQGPWFAARYLPNIPGLRAAVESILWIYASRLLRQYTSVITPSQTISDLVARMTGIRPVTISNGITLDIFRSSLSIEDQDDIRTRLQLPPQIPLILHVGRLDIDKNVERVVQAAAQVMRQTEVHLLIVGDGSQKHALMKMCEALQIADHVYFPGYVALQDGLPQIYRLADLFVTASEVEVQSLVLLEAIGSGLPIVAVQATFVPEIVHNGINGFLAKSGDIDKLADAMLTILKDRQLREVMGKNSRALAETHDTQCSIDLHEQLYSNAMKQNKLQPAWTKMNPRDAHKNRPLEN